MLRLTAPEMTVLIGGMRALGANVGQSRARRPHRPAGDVDATTSSSTCSTWAPSGSRPDSAENVYEGRDRGTRRGQVDGHRGRPRVRLELRSCGRSPRCYAADDAGEKFVRDFVAAWDKVMNLDRFDRS